MYENTDISKNLEKWCSYKEIFLKQELLTCQRRLPRKMVDRLKLESWWDVATGDLVMSLSSWVVSSSPQDVVVFNIPSSPWQMWKRKYFPRWLLKYFPVDTWPLMITAQVLYPYVNIDFPREHYHMVIRQSPFNEDQDLTKG